LAEVAFHFNVPEKLAYACRVVRKAVGLEQKVWVVTPPDQLQTLNELLWSFSKFDFIAHASASAPPEVLKHSPVVLAQSPQDLPAPHTFDVLLNLEDAVPPHYERFARVIEVVSLDELDKHTARARWKHYQQAGCSITRHDLSAA
jgi:DNA polymerase-3 subunit chi